MEPVLSPRLTRVLLVTSRKGGVGKSTLAAQLGAAAAFLGQTVILCDCDFGVRSLDLLCGVSDRALYDLGDVAVRGVEPERALIPVAERLSLIAAPVAGIPCHAGLTEAMTAFCGLCDLLILDTPRDSLCVLLAAVAGLDARLTALTVVSPHPTAVRAAELTGAQLFDSGVFDRRLIINGYVRADAQTSVISLIDETGLPLAGVLPYDADLSAAQSDGRLYPSLAKRNTRQALENIARRLNGERVPLFSGFRRVNRRKLMGV